MVATEPAGASADAIQLHYDVDAEFYALWLDELSTYSCGDWSEATDLDAAQRAKLDYFLRWCPPDDGPLLDVGCGWGSLLARAASAHGVTEATGLTLSPGQAATAQRRLPTGFDVRVEPWEAHRPADRYGSIISIGAFEHFARPGLSRDAKLARYGEFFAAMHGMLVAGGRLGLQTIAFDQASEADDGPLVRFLQDEIFPESMLPHVPEVVAAADRWFHVERLTCHASDYARTCSEWRRRLVSRRADAVDLVGEAEVQRFHRYLTSARLLFTRGDWTLARLVLTARARPKPSAA
jgi:cyclopropane-fatty-acyl-phospholipid synthase